VQIDVSLWTYCIGEFQVSRLCFWTGRLLLNTGSFSVFGSSGIVYVKLSVNVSYLITWHVHLNILTIESFTQLKNSIV
jgi:hypothetical protein